MTKKEKCPINDIYIPSIDAKDIWLNNTSTVSGIGYNLKNQNGEYKLNRFDSTLNYSLDLLTLRDIYYKVHRKKDFSFKKEGKEYTTNVINVTFKYNVKMFNQVSKTVYVKAGYTLDEIFLDDGVFVKNGELIAIEIAKNINKPLPKEMLGKFFYIEDSKYQAKSTISVLKSSADLRRSLYEEGFLCNGIKYVRYKRSAGSSRVGKCLFINESLYKRMHKWEMCGLKISPEDKIDLAALESYLSLTLSGIIGTINIQPENILIIQDYESVFFDEASVTTCNEHGLETKRSRVEISNCIWDGQSLISKEAMGEYSCFGYILLRNRFFKSACFNTNIKQWFKDNHITDISQLNGFTLAKNIESIKLITTPSSIKYLKFGNIKQWLKCVGPLFGVVKHEKRTPFFDGRMVQTHYQLLNTLPLSYNEVCALLQPSLEYLQLIKATPEILRYHINYTTRAGTLHKECISKNDIIYKFLGHNNEFEHTKLYYDFRQELVKSYLKNLRQGHLLVKGNYSTLLGNPIEMLQFAIGKFSGQSQIGVGNVYNINFPFNTELLGCRSPHCTMGNILLTINKDNQSIKKYLNLTKEIVCINSLDENILARLSGADFDSDTIMLTDSPLLIKAAKKIRQHFPVPTSAVLSQKKKRYYNNLEKADLDLKTSVNKIGEIINLAQELNSLIWDKINSGHDINSVEIIDIYDDVASLDVLSNIEIDKAKKEFQVDSAVEIKKLRNKYITKNQKGDTIKPYFFKVITQNKKHVCQKRKDYVFLHTAMDYMQICINNFKLPKADRNFLPFHCLFHFQEYRKSHVFYQQAYNILEQTSITKNQIKLIWAEENKEAVVKYQNTQERYKQLVNYIDSLKINKHTMYWLLEALASEKYKSLSRTVFYILFSSKNNNFYQLINSSSLPIKTLNEAPNGNIKIHDMYFEID